MVGKGESSLPRSKLFHSCSNRAMTMTLREVQHLSMEAWLYRRECRGHDPAKKRICCADVACSVGKLCLHIVKDSVQNIGHERNMKKHVTKHRLLLE